jgi:hypothetical protein
MERLSSITDKLFTQCINLLGNENNMKKMQTHIIDPLVTYFKYKLKFLFIVIIILLCCILIANILMVGYFINLRTLIKVSQIPTT